MYFSRASYADALRSKGLMLKGTKASALEQDEKCHLSARPTGFPNSVLIQARSNAAVSMSLISGRKTPFLG